MNRSQRADEGFISGLLRQQSRALHPLVQSHHDREPMTARTAGLPRTTALLVMDVQPGIADRYPRDVVDRAAEAVGAARRAGMPVIFVRMAFRPRHPEVSGRNRTFAVLRDAGGLLEADSAIHPALAPIPGEPIVTKRRVSAFAGSNLDVLLRARGARSLVLCGIATSGVVLSTLRAAADLDFELTVLRDACADPDPEVHRVLVDKVFPRQADLIDVGTWATGLAKQAIGAPNQDHQPID
jgi:nicotinamidase-related amidase